MLADLKVLREIHDSARFCAAVHQVGEQHLAMFRQKAPTSESVEAAVVQTKGAIGLLRRLAAFEDSGSSISRSSTFSSTVGGYPVSVSFDQSTLFRSGLPKSGSGSVGSSSNLALEDASWLA